MAAWETPLLLASEAAGAALALFAALAPWRAYRLIGHASLARFSAGLVLVAASQVLALLLHYAASQPTLLNNEVFDHLDALFWAYYVVFLLGLASVFWSFGRHPFRWTPVLTPLLAVSGPILQFLVVLFLFFVVLHAGLNTIARSGIGSGRVLSGFFLVFLAQILNLFRYGPLEPRWWGAELVQVAGLAVLAWSVARPKTMTHG